MSQVHLIRSLSVNRNCVPMSPKASHRKGDRSRLLQSRAGLRHAQKYLTDDGRSGISLDKRNPGLVMTEAEPFRQLFPPEEP